ncbi:FAD dependent oxidoreductase [Hysterangium stoloniferum]|nr:FAD dependent oxidoreductase [Hysterangium stoloniferum]
MGTNNKELKVLIVGAGAFGLSTALHLLKRGWKNVTILDRSPVLPAPDAASTDINKVIRTSYSDATYTWLAKEAVAAWKNTEDWGGSYHECGVLLPGGVGTYANQSMQNDLDNGVRVKQIHTGAQVEALFPTGVERGAVLSSSEFEGFLNLDGGWANAKQGIECAMANVCKLGGIIKSNCRVCGLTADAGGVRLEDGTEIKSDYIVVATGSWTPSSFPDLGVSERVLATGQSIATIQLLEEEAKLYAGVPVVLDYASGFYVMPPNESHIVKFGIHLAGYTHTQSQLGKSVSTPRTFVTHEDGAAIPREIVQLLRTCLSNIYPELGRRPFAGTRLCWYADTPDSDWLIDFHPEHPTVLFATGGSGHAYKFLPILGRLVADRFEKTLEPGLAKKFAYDRVFKNGHISDKTRPVSVTKEIEVSSLCTAEDLLPP